MVHVRHQPEGADPAPPYPRHAGADRRDRPPAGRLRGSDDTSNDNTSAGGNVVVTVDPNEANNVVVPERRFFNDSSPGTTASTPQGGSAPDRMIHFAQERVGVTELPTPT